MNTNIRTLIIDGDNTLWECGAYYLEKQDKFGDIVSQETGIPKEICINILKHIDVESIKLPGGFSRVRFPRSFAAASMALDLLAEKEPHYDRAAEMFHLGDSVFTAEYPLYPGVHNTLQQYKDAGYKLVLYTKGELDVQKYKINKNDVGQYFGNNVYITLVKDKPYLQNMVRELGDSTNSIAVIGDSLRDEISPANELGMVSVFISGRANGGWAYENKETTPTYEISSFSELPKILPVLSE